MSEQTPRPAGTATSSLAARPGAHGHPGRLLVLEGIDGSGRSTHIALLEEHLRHHGIGAIRTSLATGSIAGEPIRALKREEHPDPVRASLLYAADLAERSERIVTPALRAGLVVLADRWAYTPIARAEARGANPGWLEEIFSFLPSPDVTIFLDVDPETVLERRRSEQLRPFEVGSDLGLSEDLEESYRLFQGRLYASFRRQAERYEFTSIASSGNVATVDAAIRASIDPLVRSR